MKKITFLLLTLSLVSCKQNSTDSISDINELVADTAAIGVSAPAKLVSVDSSKVKELSPLFKHKKDEFSEDKIEWITPLSAAKYRNQNGVYCYFAKDNLRFVFQYHADDWLFIRNCQFLIDEKPFSYTPEEVKRDNDETGITEWFDVNVNYNDEVRPIIVALSSAKTAKVKLNGDNYYEVKTFTKKQLNSIKSTLEYYKALGNSLNNN